MNLEKLKWYQIHILPPVRENLTFRQAAHVLQFCADPPCLNDDMHVLTGDTINKHLALTLNATLPWSASFCICVVSWLNSAQFFYAIFLLFLLFIDNLTCSTLGEDTEGPAWCEEDFPPGASWWYGSGGGAYLQWGGCTFIMLSIYWSISTFSFLFIKKIGCFLMLNMSSLGLLYTKVKGRLPNN
jgi:hypothetical protein